MTPAVDMGGVREYEEKQIGIERGTIYLLYKPSCVTLAVKVKFRNCWSRTCGNNLCVLSFLSSRV